MIDSDPARGERLTRTPEKTRRRRHFQNGRDMLQKELIGHAGELLIAKRRYMTGKVRAGCSLIGRHRFSLPR